MHSHPKLAIGGNTVVDPKGASDLINAPGGYSVRADSRVVETVAIAVNRRMKNRPKRRIERLSSSRSDNIDKIAIGLRL